MADESTSSLNAKFWNELCGTNDARKLGIRDGSTQSLKVFDDWFFSFYPYLIPFLNQCLDEKEKILEVGLGFGSVSSYVASQKSFYAGLDIAESAVAMCGSRLERVPGIHSAVQGSALEAPFSDNSFDAVVAIGSLHHTGNFDKAISEMVRVVKPGGVVCGMVYSVFSIRNFLLQPLQTSQWLLANLRGSVRVQAEPKLRSLSDRNQHGQPPPSTEYFSRKALKEILRKFGTVEITARNLDVLPLPFGFGAKIRQVLLRMKLDEWIGLDLYFVVNKQSEKSK